MYSQLIRRGIPASPRPSFVCLNDGTVHLPTRTPLPTQSATIIAAPDFDGNGTVDPFVPHRDGGQSPMLWNDGCGSFPGTAVPSGPAPVPEAAAAAADIDGDGWQGLAVAGSDAPGAIWFSGAAAGR